MSRYFKKKEGYKKYAIEHTKEMENKYHDEIEWCVNRSEILSGPRELPSVPIIKVSPVVEYQDRDTVTAILCADNTTENNIWALNFASYKHPGGMFIQGSSAQEESLCRESYLYNVLSHQRFKDYYEWNRNNLNKGLYENRMIISPSVRFERYSMLDDDVCSPFFQSARANIITCAAPNYSVILRHFNTKENSEYNAYILENRIKFILHTLSTRIRQGDTIIFGAFGCGVFRQSPEMVSSQFINNLHILNHRCKVIFAVPSQFSDAVWFKDIGKNYNQTDDLRNNLLDHYINKG